MTILSLIVIEYLVILVTVLADLVSGIHKARKVGRKCTSLGLRRTVDKIARYYLALFTLTVVDVMIISVLTYPGIGCGLPPFPYLTTFGSACVAIIEIKSIFESLDHKEDFRKSLNLLASILRKI